MVLTMKELEKAFADAKTGEFKYIAVQVHIDGFPEDEIIINKTANFDSKLKYYQASYDSNCEHMTGAPVSIVDVDYEDYVDALKFFVED